jgi:imidazolonepropionase-like amidohydrolase
MAVYLFNPKTNLSLKEPLMLSRFLIVLTLCFSFQTGTFAATLVHAGKLVDVEAKEVRSEVTIVIEDNRITAVESGYRTAKQGDTVINLKAYTLLPGLMDMHTHITSELRKGGYIDRFTLNPADYTIRAVHNAKLNLMAGFTTIRDLGDQYNVTVSIRRGIQAGLIVGPRVYTTAKSIATTGGHADPTNGYADHIDHHVGPMEGVINGVPAAREAVRQRYKDGADLIKITATGGVLSLAKSGQAPQFMDDELAAIVATARDYGMTVAVHAHGAEGMKRAIKAGVDSIEHGSLMDDEARNMMIEHGTYLVPTISAGKWVAMKAEESDFFPAVVRPKAAAIGPQIQETFGKAYKAGVKIAFGTDAGVCPHGQNALEFVYMTEAGMPPMEAIRAATVYAADLLKVQDDLGSISPGKFADMIAVKGDPIADISLLQKVDFVMKDGVVYKQP